MANYYRDRIDKICADNGGRRLTKYINARAELWVQCKNNHKWPTTGTSLANKGTWCACCKGNCQHMECQNAQLDAICVKKGGKRLEDYAKSNVPITFQCAIGHKFYASPSNIKFGKGTWCPCCADRCCHVKCHNAKLDRICTIWGGSRIDDYDGNNNDIWFKCSREHKFQRTPHEVKALGWCGICSGHCREKAYHEEILDKICAEKKGIRLSNYILNGDPMWFQCHQDHKWETSAMCIKMGHWCHNCSPTRRDKSFFDEELDKICELNGGIRCSSYSESTKPVEFECAQHHPFEATVAAMRQGYWCQRCKTSSEETCRKILEEELGIRFDKERPEFLRYTSGYPLELDGYNADHRLAFEFNGAQHYRFISFYHGGDEANFHAQQARDKFKCDTAQKLGIDLIVIPYTCDNTVKKRDFIREELDRIFETRPPCELWLNKVKPLTDNDW